MSPEYDHKLVLIEDWFTVQKMWRPSGLKEAHSSLDALLNQAAPGDRDTAAAAPTSIDIEGSISAAQSSR